MKLSDLLNKSLELHAKGDLTNARKYYQAVLKIDPNCIVALGWLGTIEAQNKNFLIAQNLLEQALKLDENHSSFLLNYANLLQEIGNYEKALLVYENHLSLATNAIGLANLAACYINLKNPSQGLISAEKALLIEPNYADAWCKKGSALSDLKFYEEALACLDKALQLRPNYAEAWMNKGNVFQELKQYDEAIVHYDQALKLKSDYAEAWMNKGNVFQELKQYDEAIVHYDQALKLRPAYIDARWNRSLLLLLLGHLVQGFQDYEYRWKRKELVEEGRIRTFIQPLWLGVESLQGKTILLYGEQGLGDVIQFCRYTEKVANLGAKVILEVPLSLAGLLEGLNGVSQLIIEGQKLPAFDYQCPLLSLPLAFNTNISSIPGNVPYLKANIDKVLKVSPKLGAKKRKRIGLVWSSVSAFRYDSKRSLKLEEFVKSLPLESFEYVCLQKELKECDKDFFKTYRNIKFYGHEINDFQDTAALIENLDLVISTCTSVAHLAGALGKQTWVLLSFVPDWRWLLDRDDSPWYPSMKLFRQPALGDWDSVLHKIKADLETKFNFNEIG